MGKIGLVFVALGGLLVATTLFAGTDPKAIYQDVVRVGWGFAAIIGCHILVIGADALAWRVLMSGPRRSRLIYFWARWVREATNLLLPVGQIGGEVVGARILMLSGTDLRTASASVILD